jgi:hypothetical protein
MNGLMHRSGLVLAAAGGLFLVAQSSQAVPLSFSCITGNNLADCATGESQLAVDVGDSGDGRVLFLFSNSGPDDASITDIYFVDGRCSPSLV